MGRTCAVFGCRTGYRTEPKDPTVTIHLFPSNDQSRHEWLRRISRKNFKPSRNTGVCSKHFKIDDFVSTSRDSNIHRKRECNMLHKRYLKEDAIPSIFPPNSVYFPTATPTRRSGNATSSSRLRNDNRYLENVYCDFINRDRLSDFEDLKCRAKMDTNICRNTCEWAKIETDNFLQYIVVDRNTASVYRNEEDIGRAIKEVLLPKYNIQREDVFITSKLGPKQQGYDNALDACRQSREALQTSYLDLMLIHWPGTQGRAPTDEDNGKRRLSSWRGLEEAQKRGWVRAIGVSNFMQNHLEELLSVEASVPSVLQIEHHPMLNQKELLEFCNQKGIHYQAYSSLGSTANHRELCENPVILEIARQHNKSASQVLLKWAVQQNISVLPKSTNPEHIKENIQLFDWTLTDEAMTQLSMKLNCGHHFCWNPNAVK